MNLNKEVKLVKKSKKMKNCPSYPFFLTGHSIQIYMIFFTAKGSEKKIIEHIGEKLKTICTPTRRPYFINSNIIPSDISDIINPVIASHTVIMESLQDGKIEVQAIFTSDVCSKLIFRQGNKLIEFQNGDLTQLAVILSPENRVVLSEAFRNANFHPLHKQYLIDLVGSEHFEKHLNGNDFPKKTIEMVLPKWGHFSRGGVVNQMGGVSTRKPPIPSQSITETLAKMLGKKNIPPKDEKKLPPKDEKKLPPKDEKKLPPKDEKKLPPFNGSTKKSPPSDDDTTNV